MILACGEALVDMVPGIEAENPDTYIPCPGGSPYNTAIALGRILGIKNGLCRTAFLSRLSVDFFGEALVRCLEDNNVSVELITRSEENTTLAFVKLEKGKEPAYIFYTERTADRCLAPENIPQVLPENINCILFGSISLLMEPSASSIEKFIIRESEREEIVISLDPNVRPIMVKNHITYLNRFENWVRSSSIVKISSADIDFIYPGLNINAAGEKILGLGPRLVIITLGAGGARAVINREGIVKNIDSPAYALNISDTIGAGDTFHGAFLAWLENNKCMSRSTLAVLQENEIRQALIFANKAAAIVCSRKGADPPTLEEIQAF